MPDLTTELAPLAQPGDVRTALGVPGEENDISMLPQTMQTRMNSVLRKVSRRFRKEAQRQFTPGTYTHSLMIHAGAVRLAEVPNAVIKVCVDGLKELDYDAWQEGGEDFTLWGESGDPDIAYPTPWQPPVPQRLWRVDGAWMYWSDWDFWNLNGRKVEITYSWNTPVPQDVVDSVADIVARNLTVDPLSMTRQSKLLMSRHFRQEVADWVMDGNVGMTKDDIAQAQSYRYPTPPVIIADMSTIDLSPSVAFLSDSSW